MINNIITKGDYFLDKQSNFSDLVVDNVYNIDFECDGVTYSDITYDGFWLWYDNQQVYSMLDDDWIGGESSPYRKINIVNSQFVDIKLLSFISHNMVSYDDKGVFQVVLCNFSCEKNRLNKDDYLYNAIILDGNLRNGTSIINPSILFEYENVFKFNYCYIPKFQRYYYIIDVVSVVTNVWNISLSVDVLMSFKNQILDVKAQINRTEDGSYINPFIIDNECLTETTIIRDFIENTTTDTQARDLIRSDINGVEFVAIVNEGV